MAVVQGPQIAITPSASTIPIEQVPQHSAGPAIVLSGGGTKGDFEVGAVRCLYEQGILPNILCGTSVGSVNALKLAEGEDHRVRAGDPAPTSPPRPQGHVRGLAGLEAIWLGLKSDQDMWMLEPGIADIFNTLAKLPAEAKALLAQADDVKTDTVGGFVASILGAPFGLGFAPQAAALQSLSDQVQQVLSQLSTTVNEAENIQGLVNYDPLDKKMREPASLFVPLLKESGIKLRLAMVALEDGQLRYVTETNTMIERDGAVTKVPPPPTPAEIARLKQQRADLATQIADLEPTVPMGGHDGPIQKPNPALGALKRKLALLDAQLARMAVPMDLIRAAIASSSLPVIVRPCYMQDGQTYVDGGIRTLAPVQAAIDAGASSVYVVAAGSTKMDPKPLSDIISGTALPLLGIALRVGEQILPDEVGRRDLFPSNGWPVPVVVIQPEPELDDIHDGLTIEPGLIRIRMAHGFMRAYDTIRAFQQHGPAFYLANTRRNSLLGKTTEVTALRKSIWDLEFAANGKAFNMPANQLPPAHYTVTDLPKPDAAAHDKVRQMKQQLKSLLAERIAYYADPQKDVTGNDSLPADHNDWVANWEKHSFTPTISL
jgi:NTE family protein